MACGEDWPLCRGRFLPTFDAPTLLEYGHRLSAAGVALLVFALGLLAVRHRAEFAGRGGLLRPAGLAVALLVTQVGLGAVTVRWELPPAVVSLHLATAMALLAAILVTAVRGGELPGLPAALALGDAAAGRAARAAAGAATGAAVLGFLVVALGAVVANTGAGPLCPGFPLCQNRLIPAGGGLAHVHLTHRILAYLLVIHAAGAAFAAWRRPPSPAVRWAATGAAALIAVQVAVAAALVTTGFPATLQAIHLAAGTAVWAALVLWAVWARGARRAAAQAISSSDRA